MPVLSDMEHVVYDRPLVQGDRYVPGMFVSSGYIGNVDLYNPSLFTPEADPSEYMAGNYDAGERILAGYLRWDQNITNDLMFIAGVRVENTDLDYRGTTFSTRITTTPTSGTTGTTIPTSCRA